MTYKWESKDYLNELKKLELLIESEIDIARKSYLQRVLDSARKFHFEMFKNPPKYNPTIEQKMLGITDSILGCSRYYSIIETFYVKTAKLFPKINYLSDILESLSPDGDFEFLDTGADFSCEHCLSLTQRFYKGFDSELYTFFTEAFNDRESTLTIERKKFTPEDKSDGTTIFIDGVRKNFITVYSTTFVETYECMVHEYGHAIYNLVNPLGAYSDRTDLFSEVAAIFPELVALYENSDNLDSLQVSYYLYTLLTTYIDLAECLSIHVPLVNEWVDNNYKLNHKLKKFFSTEYDVDSEALEKALDADIDDEGIYVLSFIVSLELLHIYKEDKKTALDLFKRFLNIPANEDVFTFIQMNFDLNKNALEEAEALVDNFDKNLKRRY